MQKSRDIPQELMAKMRQQFEEDPQIIQMRIQQDTFVRQGNLSAAMAIGKKVNNTFTRVVYNYLEEKEREAETMKVSTIDMPDEAKDEMLVYILTLFMACDVIESALMDANDVLHRYEKDFNFIMFDDMRKLSDLAKEKLNYLKNNSSYMKDLVWGEKCDNIYSMMLSKAKSLMRKHRENKDWGKNAERYE